VAAENTRRQDPRAGTFVAARGPLARLAARAPEPHRAAALWALAVGPEIRRRTSVTACSEGRVRVAGLEEGWRKILEEMEADLLAGLNAQAGGRAYRRLEFREA